METSDIVMLTYPGIAIFVCVFSVLLIVSWYHGYSGRKSLQKELSEPQKLTTANYVSGTLYGLTVWDSECLDLDMEPDLARNNVFHLRAFSEVREDIGMPNEAKQVCCVLDQYCTPDKIEVAPKLWIEHMYLQRVKTVAEKRAFKQDTLVLLVSTLSGWTAFIYMLIMFVALAKGTEFNTSVWTTWLAAGSIATLASTWRGKWRALGYAGHILNAFLSISLFSLGL